jgi:hypothetical protein
MRDIRASRSIIAMGMGMAAASGSRRLFRTAALRRRFMSRRLGV